MENEVPEFMGDGETFSFWPRRRVDEDAPLFVIVGIANEGALAPV